MAKTVEQTASQVYELKQLAAVYMAGANILRTRYVSRDSMAAVSQVSCAGAPVPEEVIEMAISNLEGQAKEIEDTAKVLMTKEVKS